MKPLEHARASVKVFGGEVEDYMAIHNWFDQFRFAVKDPRHRMFLHHTAGVIICEQVHGYSITNSDGKEITVRDIAEHHIITDVGEIRTPQEWLDNMNDPEWVKPVKANLERLVEKSEKKDQLKENIDEVGVVDMDSVDGDIEKNLEKEEKPSELDEAFATLDADLEDCEDEDKESSMEEAIDNYVDDSAGIEDDLDDDFDFSFDKSDDSDEPNDELEEMVETQEKKNHTDVLVQNTVSKEQFDALKRELAQVRREQRSSFGPHTLID